MQTVKDKVYDILKDLTGVKVTPKSPKTFTELPTIVYTTSSTYVEVDLDNTIYAQPTDVKLDVWTDTEQSADTLAVQIEERMRAGLWKCTNYHGVPNPDKSLTHTVMRFVTIL